jgi:flagellar biosynthesis/type III secretory pathway protein FliH
MARHNEASALRHARQEGKEEGMTKGMEQERGKWQGMVADKDAEIARLHAEIIANSKTNNK